MRTRLANLILNVVRKIVATMALAAALRTSAIRPPAIKSSMMKRDGRTKLHLIGALELSASKTTNVPLNTPRSFSVRMPVVPSLHATYPICMLHTMTLPRAPLLSPPLATVATQSLAKQTAIVNPLSVSTRPVCLKPMTVQYAIRHPHTFSSQTTSRQLLKPMQQTGVLVFNARMIISVRLPNAAQVRNAMDHLYVWSDLKKMVAMLS